MTSRNAKRLLGRLVQELDGAGVLVAGGGGEAHRGGPQVAILLRRERDAVRLLDDLLVAPLHAAVAHAGGPDGAVGVGDELDLDVAGAGDDALHEHRRVAEGLEPFGGRSSNASASPASSSTRRMPRPPPPAVALIISG